LTILRYKITLWKIMLLMKNVLANLAGVSGLAAALFKHCKENINVLA
jgi:hypothetical protein